MTYPTLEGEQGWPALHDGPPSVWKPALAELSAAWGLAEAWERLPGGEDSVVFAQSDCVVKLVPPFLHADAEREVPVLRRVALPVPTPRVLDVREKDGWTAVRLSRLKGVPAAQVWADVPHEDRKRILGEVGALLRALWDTPIVAADGDPIALLARFRARLGRHEADGFTDATGFASRHLPDPLPPPALLHHDVNDGNLMLERRPNGWEVSGVLDFVASRASYPPLDLVTPTVFFCRGDATLLRSLLHGAGADGLGADELSAWHLLHPFSQLHRDLGFAGRGMGTTIETDLRAFWARG